MTAFVRLSHDIRAGDPGWPGNFTYEYEQVSSTERGDVANFGILHLLNHFGTHLDAPNHFNPDGLKIATVRYESYPGIRDGIIIRQFPLRGAPVSARDAISVVVSKQEEGIIEQPQAAQQ